MTENEAKQIALQFISKHPSEHCSLHFKAISRSVRHSNQWAVAFEVRAVGGGILEGPVFVMVHEEDGEARYFG